MLMKSDLYWVFKVIGMQHMQMNWQISLSTVMQVKFDSRLLLALLQTHN